MNVKIISVLVTGLMILGSFGVFGTNITNKIDNDKESIVDVQTVISGYRVDNKEKVGTIGEFTRTLSKNNDLGIEIIKKRTPTDRFFKNDDDTITAYLSVNPTCYKDENGIWHDGKKLESSGISTLDDKWEDNSNCYGYVYYYHFDDWDKDEVLKMGSNVYNSGRNNILIGQHNNEWGLVTHGYLRKYSRGFAMWDIGPVPDGLDEVTNIDLSFYVSDEKDGLYHEKGDITHRQYADLRIISLEDVKPSDYSTGSNTEKGSSGWNKLQNLMKDCSDGWTFSQDRVKRSSPGMKTWSLSATACDLFENKLSDDYFAVGFDDKNENQCGEEYDAGGIILDGEGTPSDAGLVLEVTYSLNAGDVALFIEGGTGDRLQSAFHNSAVQGRNIFRDQLSYGSDRVKLLSKPTKSGIKTALKDLALEMCNGNNIFVYLCDHGVGNPSYEDSWWSDHFGPDWINHEGKFVLNPGAELLSWDDLADMLDEFHALKKKGGRTGYGTATIVVEACFSGHFISEASKLHKDADGENHIIITASGKDHVSWGYTGSNGFSVFTNYFFNALKDGQISYGRAWEISDAKVYNWIISNPKYVSKSLEEDENINNIFKTINKKFSNSPLFELLVKLMKNHFEAGDNIPCPQFYPFEDWQNLFRNDNDIIIQCPLLSDNGVFNHAGTEGPNKVDSLPMNGNGGLAEDTYP